MKVIDKILSKSNAKALLPYIVLGSLLLSSMPSALAGGIALGTTRVIYPVGANQVSLSITNSDSKNIFLIQSWISNADGEKSSDFIITPPLFVIKPDNENTLRIMYVGQKQLPEDRETVYYLNSKAIPSGAPSTPGENTLQIATQSVIKLFYRPAGLSSKSDSVINTLSCQYTNEGMKVSNPSPYYVTLVNIILDGKHIPNTMLAPLSDTKIGTYSNKSSGIVSFQTVNDYGANTPEQKCVMK